MLTGLPPFAAGSMAEVLTAHLHQEPEPLPPFVPTAVAELTLSLLAKDPQERPESAAEVVRSLRIARLSALPQAPNPGFALVLRRMMVAVIIGSVRGWHHCVAWAERMQRRAKPHLMRAWQWSTRRAPALRMLERRVRLGSRSISFGAIGLCVLALVLVLSTLFSEPTASASRPEATNTEIPTASELSGETEQHSLEPDEAAVQEILAVPVYKRTREQWLALGNLYEQRQAWKDSIFAYRNALQLAPELKDDGNLLQRLRGLSEQPEVYESVLNVALNLLGPAGMDLIYDLWLGTRHDESKQFIAEAASKSLMIHRLRSASPALKALLELQFIGAACDKTQRLMKDALKHADERIVPLLRAQKAGTCGKAGQEICVPCLQRPQASLQPVMAAAAARKAPRFTGQSYVKGR